MSNIAELFIVTGPFTIGIFSSLIAAIIAYIMRKIAARKRVEFIDLQRDREEELRKQVDLKETRIAYLHKELYKLRKQFSEDKGAVSSSLQEVDKQIEDFLHTKLSEQEEKSRAELEKSLRNLRTRLDKIEKRFPSTETIETITNVNEAILSTKLETLASNIERVEKKTEEIEKSQLTQWDVAKTIFAVLSVIAAVTGIVFGLISIIPKSS